MTLIGLSGKKRSGKDTIADMIISNRERTVKFAFANTLKMEVARATGFSIEYQNANKENFRLIYQGWGTDFRRKLFGQDYWIKKMEEAIAQLSNQYDTLIIPDVRFRNEYDWIKNQGGIIIRVERGVDYSDTHVSENELDGATFDHTIYNFGTRTELHNKVAELLNKI